MEPGISSIDDLAEEAIGHERLKADDADSTCLLAHGAVRAIPCKSRHSPIMSSPSVFSINSSTATSCPKPNSNIKYPRCRSRPTAWPTSVATMSMPASPPKSATGGSKSRTSGCSAGRSTVANVRRVARQSGRMCRPRRRDTLVWTKRIRPSMPCRSAFRRATSSATCEMSVATTVARGSSRASATAKHPLPVHASAISEAAASGPRNVPTRLRQ